MKNLKHLLLGAAIALAILITPTQSNAATTGWAGEKFQKVIYFCGTTVGTGNHSGINPANCMPIVDGTIATIEAKSVVEHVYVIITTLLTGTSDLDIGDTNSSNGFVDGSASLTLGTVGVYSYAATVTGSYLHTSAAVTSGGTGQQYIVPQAKFFATADPVLLDVTTANTAGAFQVVIEGYKYK